MVRRCLVVDLIVRGKITMPNRIGFDNEKYIAEQSAEILQRIEQFGDKLFLEFAENCYMTIMRRGFCPVMILMLKCGYCRNLKIK